MMYLTRLCLDYSSTLEVYEIWTAFYNIDASCVSATLNTNCPDGFLWEILIYIYISYTMSRRWRHIDWWCRRWMDRDGKLSYRIKIVSLRMGRDTMEGKYDFHQRIRYVNAFGCLRAVSTPTVLKLLRLIYLNKIFRYNRKASKTLILNQWIWFQFK